MFLLFKKKHGLQAQCTARLCGKGRVFNGEDGLCHDVYDALECRGGRRFYYTAFGDPICDCPIGQVPFPRPSDPCVPLFTRGALYVSIFSPETFCLLGCLVVFFFFKVSHIFPFVHFTTQKVPVRPARW